MGTLTKMINGLHCVCLLETWKGGARLYAASQQDAIKAALLKFQQQNDTKAEASVSMSYTSGKVCTAMTASLLI
jgi:hypothetical protein